MSLLSSESYSPPPTSNPYEALELALTILSFPMTPPKPAPTILNQESEQQPCTPSSLSSWVDLPPTSTSLPDNAAPSRENYRGVAKRRRKKGVREGLSRLVPPPPPFGCQLGTQASRSTSYRRQHRHDLFNPRPIPRALSVENNEIPTPCCQPLARPGMLQPNWGREQFV